MCAQNIPLLPQGSNDRANRDAERLLGYRKEYVALRLCSENQHARPLHHLQFPLLSLNVSSNGIQSGSSCQALESRETRNGKTATALSINWPCLQPSTGGVNACTRAVSRTSGQFRAQGGCVLLPPELDARGYFRGAFGCPLVQCSSRGEASME